MTQPQLDDLIITAGDEHAMLEALADWGSS
jgi:hypothetical protein